VNGGGYTIEADKAALETICGGPGIREVSGDWCADTDTPPQHKYYRVDAVSEAELYLDAACSQLQSNPSRMNSHSPFPFPMVGAAAVATCSGTWVANTSAVGFVASTSVLRAADSELFAAACNVDRRPSSTWCVPVTSASSATSSKVVGYALYVVRCVNLFATLISQRPHNLGAAHLCCFEWPRRPCNDCERASGTDMVLTLAECPRLPAPHFGKIPSFN
jgi:hypothetical protein